MLIWKPILIFTANIFYNNLIKTLFIYTIGLPYLCYRWKLKKIEAKKKAQRNLNERINESEQEDTGKRLEMPHEGKVEYNVPSIVILVLGFLSFFMGFFVLVSAPFELYTKNINTISFIVMFVLGLILIYLGFRMIKKSIIKIMGGLICIVIAGSILLEVDYIV